MKKFKVNFEHKGTLYCSATVIAEDESEIDVDTIFEIAQDIEDDGFEGDSLEITNIEEIDDEEI